MHDASHRSTLFILTFLALGVAAAFIATSTEGAVTAPWWLVCLVLCLFLPHDSWSDRSVRGRLGATIGLVLSCLVFVGGLAVTASSALAVLVIVPLWLTVALLVTPRLRGHRILALAVFGAPVLMGGAAIPVAVEHWSVLRTLNMDAAFAAISAAVGPMLLAGGAALVIGSVTDLLLRLRTRVSPGTVRAVSFVLGGLTLVIVAAAGAVAAGSFSGTASRIGSLGVVLTVGGLVALAYGLRRLEAEHDIPAAGGGLAVAAVAAVLAGTILLPTEPLVTGVSLLLLLVFATLLGSITGLCGAAALLRARRPHTPRARFSLAELRATLRARYLTH